MIADIAVKRVSEQELIEYIQKNLENSPMIDVETGIAAVEKLAMIAEKVVKVGGEDAWQFAKLRFWGPCDLADNADTTEDKYYSK